MYCGAKKLKERMYYKMKKEKVMKIVIFAVVLLIPIIYSFFYLKSYWDPYGNLTDMKIAIINLDKGKDEENEGKEFVQSIKDSNVFNICEVDEDEASKGMQDGKYYATITIPINFTESLNSASSTDKQIAQITYSPNQATNYLATQIVNSAVKTMETSLEEQISGKVVENLSDKLKEVPESLEKTADGAKQILDGSQSLNSGLKELNDGASTLNNSYSEFDNGVKSASEGSKTLDNGIAQVDSGVSNLNSGASSLDSAISKVSSGVNALSSQSTSKITTLTNGITSVNTGASQLNTGITEYVKSVNGLLQSLKAKGILQESDIEPLQEAGSTLKKSSSALNAGTQNLKNGATELSTLANSLTTLPTYLSQIKEGSTQLKNGIATLSTGTKTLKTGSNSLTAGLATLSNSSSTVKNALNTLQAGTQSAYDGSTELVNGAQTFNDEISKGIDETREQLKSLDGLKEFVENPVEFKTEEYGEVNSYGIAFTPLFLSIGLWVGSLMCYVVLYYDQKNRFGIFGSNDKNKLLQNILYIGIGAIQGIITGALLKLGLGFEIQNVALYYLSSILIGITFMSIVQCLMRNFGDVGKFLALIILVLQLAASGGTFPIETISKGFQPLSAYLPMTYAIKLLREVLVPTASNFKGSYISILLCITVSTLIITYIVDIIRDKIKSKET